MASRKMVWIWNHLVWNGTCLQGRNRDPDVGNGLKDTGRGKERVGQIERVALTYTHSNS